MRQWKNSFWRRWLTRWLVERLPTESVDKRSYLLQALGKVGDETALKHLIAAMKDPDETVRRFAISALVDYGGPYAVETLIEALRDPESDIRAAAATALGQSRDLRATDALIETLEDAEPSVRAQAVIALGHLQAREALIPLQHMMQNESSEWMLRYVTQAIAEIKGGSTE